MRGEVCLAKGKRTVFKLLSSIHEKPSEAGESDAQWVPIHSGTDSAFLLGMMHEIFKNRFFDVDYLKKHTNSDMLINVETGLPIQTRKIEKESKGKKVEILDYLVSSDELNLSSNLKQKPYLIRKI